MKTNKLLLTLLLLIHFFLFITVVEAQKADLHANPAVILSGCEIDYPPFCIVHPDGRADGFSVELMQKVAAQMGCEVSFATGTWVQVRGLLERGEIQALPLVGRTPEREELFDFSVPYLTMYGAIVVREDSKDINDLADLRGRNVAVMQGDNAEEFLRRSDRGINIITEPSFVDAFKTLSQEGCDAVVIQRLVALRLLEETGLKKLRVINKPIMEFRQDFCFAVNKGDSRTLALINEGLALAMADGTYRQLHAKWFASLEIPSFRRIIVGGDANYPPYDFFDENGKATGLAVEITRATARAAGLDVDIRLGHWPDVKEDLAQGRIDAIMGMLYSTERDLKFDFSPPHTICEYVIAYRSNVASLPAGLEDLAGRSVMVIDSDFMHEMMLAKKIAANLIVASSLEVALNDFSNGKGDFVLTPRLTAMHLIKEKKLANIELTRQPLHSTEYCFAFANGNKALLAKFTEGLKVIEASGEYRQIQEKWLGIYGAREKDYRAVFRYLATITTPLLVILLLVFIWSWTLRRQVARKTRELQQSEAQFRSLVEGAPTGIFVQSDGNFVYLNDETSRLFGATSIVQLFNKAVLDLIDQSAHENYIRCVDALSSENKQPALAIVIRRLDGSKVPVEVTVAPIDYRGKDSALVFVQDTTEKLRLNEQLQHAQKMEAIGQLAGGVAHDYNNMLGVILGYAELALDSVDKESPPHEYLSEIHKAALRSAEITGQLLAFARKQTIAPRILDMNETIDGMLKMLRRLIGEAISLTWVPGSGPLAVKMDPTQISQILANLCVNARDAMSGAGKLLIETTAVAFDEDYCSDHPGTLTGDYVQLSVSDDGCGIDAAAKDKIFEPFFTTKAVGQGTGLGLATVFGIVKQNHGFINVYSEIEQGTTFKIYIPMYDIHHTQMLKSQGSKPVAGSGETVLIVEDDPSILRLASKMLTRVGYTVIATDSPTEAIRQGENSAQKIDLLLTDVVMPEMNGRELYVKLQICRPGLRCLFMSGYTANVIAQHGVLKEGINFVAKPFSNADLVKAVREALGRPT
ncbi:MAG: hypothetical protein A2W80_10100 [Candidatus Riflebacteria bacterium GWC2_50_8]|nr:MAG: hypothetical protein A2W80_10100 [Candidatus Riflebacteria bacterium GWC2_50_8]